MKKFKVNSTSALVSTSLAMTIAATPVVQAEDSPFSMTELRGGFTVAENAEARQCGNFCGGANPTVNEAGEMVKCGSVCGEVAKCGNLCGGFGDKDPRTPREDSKDGEVVKCGNLCASQG